MEIKELSRANIAQESKIRLVDTHEETGLNLYCYNECSNDENYFIKQCRGVVFHGDTLVMKAFPYTDEYPHTDMKVLEKVLENFSKWHFYTAYEGSLLRLFFFSGRWFLTTHRKFDAFRSKWASKESFGTLFKKALEHEAEINQTFKNSLKEGENILDKFQSTLDKTKQYMFLLRNNQENRIVCEPPKESDTYVFHVGTFSEGKLINDNISLSKPAKLSFLNIDELVDYVENKTDPTKTQGVICFGPDNTQVKVLHKTYLDMTKVRGNVPSINFRYLQVRTNKPELNNLYKLYPSQVQNFNNIESTLFSIANNIFLAYKERYIIREQFVSLPQEEYLVMAACHEWHLSDRQKNKVSLDKVIQELNKQTPTNLNRMIRRYKLEQYKKN